MRTAVWVVTACLAACGGSAPEVKPEPKPAPEPVKVEVEALHPHVIEAPTGVDRWEPSGAAVVGEKLWVVNDRGGWIASYALPLAAGVNKPSAAHQIAPERLDPVRTEAMSRALAPRIAKILAKRMKWEDLAPDGKGGVLLLEAISRTVWRCGNPDAGCPELKPFDVSKANAKLESLLPMPVAYYSLEGLAVSGDRVLVGTRGLMPEDSNDDDFRPWAIVVEPGGEHTYDGEPWELEGRKYGISSLALDGDTLWMTWSYESDADGTKSGVAGVLAKAALDPTTGMPGKPEFCSMVAGKPEGLAVHGDALLVVFDNDKARKAKGDETRFDLTPAQDFARIIPKSACAPAK